MKKPSVKGLIRVDLIQAFIKLNNLTQEAFAKMCNISTNTLRNILSGVSNIKVIKLLKIARVMKVKFKQLLSKQVQLL